MDFDKLSSRFLLEVNQSSRRGLRPLSIADIEIDIANGCEVRVAAAQSRSEFALAANGGFDEPRRSIASVDGTAAKGRPHRVVACSRWVHLQG